MKKQTPPNTNKIIPPIKLVVIKPPPIPQKREPNVNNDVVS